MKKLLTFAIIILIVSSLSLSIGFAQDDTTDSTPDTYTQTEVTSDTSTESESSVDLSLYIEISSPILKPISPIYQILSSIHCGHGC